MLKQTARSQVETERGLKRTRKSHNSSKPSPQYEFVTSVGPPTNTSKTAAAKQVVRIHAMRSFLRHRDAGLIDGTSNNRKEPPIHQPQAPMAGKFKLDTWSRKSSKRKGKAQEAVVAKLTIQQADMELPSIQPDLGPFELLNIPLTPQVRRLLHHCMDTAYRYKRFMLTALDIDHHDFTQNSFAVNPEGSFFDFAVNDVGLLHSILSMVALHFGLSHNNKFDASSPGPVYDQALYHQNEAIRIVNQTIGISGHKPSDALMATVALLANYEVSLPI